MRSETTAAIKTGSQVESSVKSEVVRAQEKEHLFAVYIMRLYDSRKKFDRLWQQEI